MVWPDFEMPQFFMIENSKKRIKSQYRMCYKYNFWEVGSYYDTFKKTWEHNPNEFHSTLCSDVAMRIC